MPKAYIFDFDDNIITMPSTISIEKQTGPNSFHIKNLSTKEYAEFDLKNSEYHLYPDSFNDFRNRQIFLGQLEEAIQNFEKTKGASYKDFKEAVLSLSTICIITARGHDRKVIKEGLMMLIDMLFNKKAKEKLYTKLNKEFTNKKVSELEKMNRISKKEKEKIIQELEHKSNKELLNLYLKNQFVYCVNGEQRMEQFPKHKDKKTPERKLVSLKDFLENKNLNDIVSVGFSDDDPKNLKEISNFLKKESKNYGIKCKVYSTAEGRKDRVF